MYVIKRTDRGGGYVLPPGLPASYTVKLQEAKTYPTREAAEKDRCPDNEVVVSVYSEMRG